MSLAYESKICASEGGKAMKKRKNSIVLKEYGVKCPRCKRMTVAFEHRQITDKLKRQPFYYRRWFYCIHDDCKTTYIMLPEYKVFPDNSQIPDSAIFSWSDMKNSVYSHDAANQKPPWEE